MDPKPRRSVLWTVALLVVMVSALMEKIHKSVSSIAQSVETTSAAVMRALAPAQGTALSVEMACAMEMKLH